MPSPPGRHWHHAVALIFVAFYAAYCRHSNKKVQRRCNTCENRCRICWSGWAMPSKNDGVKQGRERGRMQAQKLSGEMSIGDRRHTKVQLSQLWTRHRESRVAAVCSIANRFGISGERKTISCNLR
uniref:Putative secreted protein n=1 Tax=Ixodes ricinus TaxID=34613 RepID=A0A6B0UPH3_IXORI